MSVWRFVDLFAGIGGLRQAMDVTSASCVMTCERNRFALQTYRANFKEDHRHFVVEDIRQLDACQVPDHDILLAGFPCQPFSTAGVSSRNHFGHEHGFLCESQGTLFFDLARIIQAKRPAAFLLENVKNLCSHDDGKTFEVIYSTLLKLGYHVQFQVIDGRSWVPQKRQRIFVVGYREAPVYDFADFRAPLQAPLMDEVLHRGDVTEPYLEDDGTRYVTLDGAVREHYLLSERLWAFLQEHARKHGEAGNGFGFGLVGREDVARTLTARYCKDGSEILVRTAGPTPRRLTPREAARLMGFSDHFVIPVSDSQAYRQFGNSVIVPLVQDVMRWILRDLQAQGVAPGDMASVLGPHKIPDSVYGPLFAAASRGGD